VKDGELIFLIFTRYGICPEDKNSIDRKNIMEIMKKKIALAILLNKTEIKVQIMQFFLIVLLLTVLFSLCLKAFLMVIQSSF